MKRIVKIGIDNSSVKYSLYGYYFLCVNTGIS